MKFNTDWIVGLVIMGSLAATSCASPGKKTAAGAGVGAAGGAVVGGAVGGWQGAAIGAGAGALAGGAVGNYLDKQADELEKVAETKRTDEGVLVNLKSDVLFDTGKADVKPEAIAQLNKVGGILAKYPEDRIRVQGYTDSIGSNQSNEKLSDHRAEAVRDLLSKQGVKPQQLLVEGYGSLNPVASNKNSTGRAKNRRVELRIDIPQAPT